MIEILFSDSARGSLKAAQHYGVGKYLGGSIISVYIHKLDGSNPTKAETEAAEREAEEKERIKWESATPFGGNASDVFSFSLALSVGDITEENAIFNRQRVLEQLFSSYPNSEGDQIAQKIINTSTNNLAEIHHRIDMGEAVRIWYSNQPDDMCGLYWFMAQLSHSEISDTEIAIVKLPEWEQLGKNVIIRNGWNEVSPEEWHRYLDLQKSIPTSLIKNYASSWQTLQSENAPLRAVLNGRLTSMPATLYDDFILRAIAEECTEFLEANVIGRVIGRYQLSICDGLVALRIEEMIRAGNLQVTSTAADDMYTYRRMLKKCYN